LAAAEAPQSTGVILAAGEGSRFVAAGGIGAKCLTTEAGIGPLLWTVEVLMSCGIEKLIIVTGKYDRDVREAIQGLRHAAAIQFVRNTAWANSNTAYSFALAATHLTGSVTLTYADVYVSAGLVGRLLRHPAPNVAAIEHTASVDDIDMRATLRDGVVAVMAKDLPDHATAGESACLFRFDHPTCRMLSSSVLGGMSPTADQRTVEDLITENGQAIQAAPVWCERHEWCEIDVPSHLLRAKTFVDRHKLPGLARRGT
jgi:choline kinase